MARVGAARTMKIVLAIATVMADVPIPDMKSARMENSAVVRVLAPLLSPVLYTYDRVVPLSSTQLSGTLAIGTALAILRVVFTQRLLRVLGQVRQGSPTHHPSPMVPRI